MLWAGACRNSDYGGCTHNIPSPNLLFVGSTLEILKDGHFLIIADPLFLLRYQLLTYAHRPGVHLQQILSLGLLRESMYASIYIFSYVYLGKKCTLLSFGLEFFRSTPSAH